MRLQLSELQADGLLTVGWIWRIDGRVDLSSLRSKFHLRWTACKQLSPLPSHHPDPLRTDNEDFLLEMNALSADFFYQLLQDLIGQDLQDVADAIWHLIRPTWHKQWGRRCVRWGTNPKWLQEMNRDKDVDYARELLIENGMRPASLQQLSDPIVKASFMKVAEDCWRAPSNLGWLFDQVMTQGSLYCGHLMREEQSTPCINGVIFDCSEPAFVFTPYAEEVCTITGPVQPRLNPISWLVTNYSRHSDSRVSLLCHNIVQGIWERPEKLFEEVYLL